MKKVKEIFPFVIAAVFLFSGISKLISVDFFEQYIYSFRIISLNLSILISRLIIGFELTLSIFFSLKIYKKTTTYITLITLSLFTIFILYSGITGISDDCHCFGALIQLSNSVSIIKNLIIIALIIVYLKSDTEISKNRLSKAIVAILIGFISSFAFNFPTGIITKNHEIKYCNSCFEKILDDTKLNKQRKIFCFLSVNCKYCKLAAQRISVMSQKAQNTNDIIYFLWDDKNQSDKFFKETKSIPFTHYRLNVIRFMDATSGTMPLIILYENGKVVKTFRYSDMDENEMILFLKN